MLSWVCCVLPLQPARHQALPRQLLARPHGAPQHVGMQSAAPTGARTCTNTAHGGGAQAHEDFLIVTHIPSLVNTPRIAHAFNSAHVSTASTLKRSQ
jgi:hypothetical protein